MKSKILVVIWAILALVFVAQAGAQTTPPAQPVLPGWTFSVSGGYSNVSNAPTNNGFAAVTELKVWKYADNDRSYLTDVSARGDVFMVQNPNVIGNYVGPQATLWKTNVNGAATEFFANVKFGDIRSNDPANNSRAKFSWGLGGGFNIRLSDHTFIRPLDISYIRGSVFQGGGTVIGNHLEAAALLGVRF